MITIPTNDTERERGCLCRYLCVARGPFGVATRATRRCRVDVARIMTTSHSSTAAFRRLHVALAVAPVSKTELIQRSLQVALGKGQRYAVEFSKAHQDEHHASQPHPSPATGKADTTDSRNSARINTESAAAAGKKRKHH